MNKMYKEFIKEDLYKLSQIKEEVNYFESRSAIRLIGGDTETSKLCDFIVHLLKKDYWIIKKRMINEYNYKTVPQLLRELQIENGIPGKEIESFDHLFTTT